MNEVATIAAIALPVGMGDFSAAGRSTKNILLLAGDHDAYCPKGAITKLAESSGARLKIIDGADHFFGGREQALTDALGELLAA
jgi:alpha/beta superfamily hydrolase